MAITRPRSRMLTSGEEGTDGHFLTYSFGVQMLDTTPDRPGWRDMLRSLVQQMNVRDLLYMRNQKKLANSLCVRQRSGRGEHLVFGSLRPRTKSFGMNMLRSVKRSNVRAFAFVWLWRDLPFDSSCIATVL